MPFIHANGMKIHFEDTQGDKPAVVFNHGFFMDSTMFDAQRDALAESYRVISIDARGHGKTADEDAAFSYWDLARDTLAVMDHLEINRAVVAGMSQGGFTALRVALLAPERVAGLVLISTEASSNPEPKKAGYRELFAVWEEHGPSDGLVEGLAGQLIGDAHFAKPWMERWQQIPYSQIRHAGETLIERDDIADSIPHLKMPALVAYGAMDSNYTDADQEAFAGALNTWKLERFEDAGHALNITRAERFNGLLLEFLAQVPTWQAEVSR